MKDSKIIYPTAWKPTLVKGVPRDYAVFMMIIVAVIIGFIGKLWVAFPLFAIAWLYGFLKAKEDPEFFTVQAIRFLKLKSTKGKFKGRKYFS